MTLLQTIDEALRTNPKVIIVDKDEEHRFENQTALHALKWHPNQTSHDVWYHIAPTQGLYTAECLNVFQDLLFPTLGAERKNHFYDRNPSLSLGSIHFKEIIGTGKIIYLEEVELSDADSWNIDPLGFQDGKRKITQSYDLVHERAIIIKAYPDAQLAKDLLEGKFGTTEGYGNAKYETTKYVWDIPMEAIRNNMPENHPLKPKPPRKGFWNRLTG